MVKYIFKCRCIKKKCVETTPVILDCRYYGIVDSSLFMWNNSAVLECSLVCTRPISYDYDCIDIKCVSQTRLKETGNLGRI